MQHQEIGLITQNVTHPSPYLLCISMYTHMYVFKKRTSDMYNEAGTMECALETAQQMLDHE
ncbi:MAG: hypothetical protein R6U55_06320 [Desulfovermiculus sp.]